MISADLLAEARCRRRRSATAFSLARGGKKRRVDRRSRASQGLKSLFGFATLASLLPFHFVAPSTRLCLLSITAELRLDVGGASEANAALRSLGITCCCICENFSYGRKNRQSLLHCNYVLLLMDLWSVYYVFANLTIINQAKCCTLGL